MAESLRERLARIQERVERAAERSGRRAQDITLIAVSKTFDADIVQVAADAGVRDFGENRVQEAAGKVPRVRGDNLRWHLIGHLQSNKARTAVATFDFIHTIDNGNLVDRLNRIAGELGRRLPVLAQVDLAGESTKSGVDEKDLPGVLETFERAGSLDLLGFMTMPPFFDEPEQARGYFRRLRELMETINRCRTPEKRLRELSMGMSHDFEVAIEEGATMVRIGTAIFGSRPTTRNN